jgi:hypothetical protein
MTNAKTKEEKIANGQIRHNQDLVTMNWRMFSKINPEASSSQDQDR